MKVFALKFPDGMVLLRSRAEGDGVVGDLVIEVFPGGSALGKSYDEWAAEAVEERPAGAARVLYFENTFGDLAIGDEFAIRTLQVATEAREQSGPVLAATVPAKIAGAMSGGRAVLPRGLKLRVTGIEGDVTYAKAVKPKKRRR